MQRSHESSEGAMSHTGCCATIFFGADLRAGCRLGYSFVERMKMDCMEGTMTSITRRSVLRGAIAVAAGAFAGRAVLTPIRVFAQARPGASAEGVKALVYDVFGTWSDWRNEVASDAERHLK